MRIWHKDLIPVLPDKQLLGQWRECCLIAKLIKENGTPNHLLVNKVTQFPIDHLYNYASLIFGEMTVRGFNCNWMSIEKHLPQRHLSYIPFPDLFDTEEMHWHTLRYFWQCFCNLEEKYDCGGISDSDWEAIRKIAIHVHPSGCYILDHLYT